MSNIKNISILVPTLARPNNIENLVESVYETSSSPDKIEIIFYIDKGDDLSIKKIIDLQKKYSSSFIGFFEEPKILFAEMWNFLYKKSSADIFMACGDDVVFRTKNWDNLVIEQFNLFDDRIAFVHGDDGYFGKKFATHGFVHRNWTEITGYLLPPYFVSEWTDTWLNFVSNHLGRRVYIEALFEHMHPNFSKSKFDETYRANQDRGQKENVAKKYQEMLNFRFNDINKLRKFIYKNAPNYIIDLFAKCDEINYKVDYASIRMGSFFGIQEYEYNLFEKANLCGQIPEVKRNISCFTTIGRLSKKIKKILKR